MTQVSNPYKAALKAARANVVGVQTSVDDALSTAKSLMSAGAWDSGASGGASAVFLSGVTAQTKAATGGVTTSLADLDAVIAKEPDMVDSNAWQCHWHNL